MSSQEPSTTLTTPGRNAVDKASGGDVVSAVVPVLSVEGKGGQIVIESVDEEASWHKPFLDTGRGGLALPPVVIDTYTDEQAAKSWAGYLTSVRTRHLFAGGLAGGMTRIITHPLDRIRTSMMLHPNDINFATMSTTFRTFIRDLGWRVGLFRGLDIALLKIVPEVALKFAVYEEIKRNLVASHGKKKGTSATFVDRFASGAAAGIVSHSVCYPIKVVQVRLSNQRPFGSEFNGIMDAFKKLYATTGLLGFYRGFLISVTGMAPSMGLDFAVYGLLKKLYKRHWHVKGQHPPGYVLLVCGTVASSVAHTLTYPLVLARIRLQAGEKRALRIYTWRRTMFSYLRSSYQRDGLRKGLYRGLTPSLAKVVPAVSLSFFFYEKITHFLVPTKTNVLL